MQPRYFIAIILPDDIRHRIGKVQHELFQPGKVMQPLKPHITLLHPNMLMSLPPMHFVPKIKKVADQILPIKIKLTKTDLFDDRVLHIAVESSEIYKLYDELVNHLPEEIKARYTVGRPFVPHITLNQAKPKQSLDSALIDKFKEKIDPLLPQTFTVNNLHQFKWLRPRIYKITAI